ncbi:MAG: hypothetical protein AAGD13_15485 [Pseudomonadota bacterium]
MHFRFVVRDRDEVCGLELGFFQRAYSVRNGEIDAPPWVRDQLRLELGWFNLHLDVPERFGRSAGRRGWIRGICWFRPEAHQAIDRARYVAWLMTEAEVPVEEIRRSCPGEVIWQDHQQVVAKPPRDLAKAFG